MQRIETGIEGGIDKINNSKVIRNVFVNESTKANSNSQFNSNSNSIKQVRKHTSDMELQLDSKLK